MKNKAKCKLCSSIIESFHSSDYVECSCGEISVNCGIAMVCGAKNWDNFLRLDENDNVIVVKVKENEPEIQPTKKELIEMLKMLTDSYQKLPEAAMTGHITHYDFTSLLILLSALFEADS